MRIIKLLWLSHLIEFLLMSLTYQVDTKNETNKRGVKSFYSIWCGYKSINQDNFWFSFSISWILKCFKCLCESKLHLYWTCSCQAFCSLNIYEVFWMYTVRIVCGMKGKFEAMQNILTSLYSIKYSPVECVFTEVVCVTFTVFLLILSTNYINWTWTWT